jgi:hypothetical protein
LFRLGAALAAVEWLAPGQSGPGSEGPVIWIRPVISTDAWQKEAIVSREGETRLLRLLAAGAKLMDRFLHILTSGRLTSFDVAHGGLGPLAITAVMLFIWLIYECMVKS